MLSAGRRARLSRSQSVISKIPDCTQPCASRFEVRTSPRQGSRTSASGPSASGASARGSSRSRGLNLASAQGASSGRYGPSASTEPHRQRWLRTLIRGTVRPCRAASSRRRAGSPRFAQSRSSHSPAGDIVAGFGHRRSCSRRCCCFSIRGSLPVRECRSLAPRAPPRNGYADRCIVGHTNHISAGARMANKDEGGFEWKRWLTIRLKPDTTIDQ